MQIVLFDNDSWRQQTYPLSLTRPVSNLRIGTLTINEKWEKWLNVPVSYLTALHLQKKYPLCNTGADVLLISGNVLPNEALVENIDKLKKGEALIDQNGFIALKADSSILKDFNLSCLKDFKSFVYSDELTKINYPEDIFMKNEQEIKRDFSLLTKSRSSANLCSSNTFLGDQIFAEDGAKAECSILNSLNGPIYLAKDSSIWEGCMVRGAFSLGENSQLKMGTKVYSKVSIGPNSRMGGELNTCVVWGNSAKGHDGYLGSSVLGEWCNWGAGTNCSNMKNNYKAVRLFDYESNSYRETGLDFCGLIMADHSKCAINTTFNTGTIVGVSANVFGSGVLPNFIPDFTWGGTNVFAEYQIDKMFETAELVFRARNRKFDQVEKDICSAVFEITKEKRNI